MSTQDHDTASSQRTTVGTADDMKVVPWDTNLAYLADEIAWIEARVICLGLRRQQLAAPEDRAVRRRGYHCDDDDVEPDVLAERLADAEAREALLRATIDARLTVHRETGFDLAIDRLCTTHELDSFERAVLLLATSTCVSGRVERLLAALEQERQATLTVDAVFAFLDLPFAERVTRRWQLGPRGRLLRADLVELAFGSRAISPRELLSTQVELRGRTFAFLLGDCGLGDELADLASVEEPLVSFDRLVIPEADKARILRVVEGHDQYVATRAAWGLDERITYGRGVVMLFAGPSGVGKTACAHAVAAVLGKRVLNVDLPTFGAHQEAARFLPGLFREARLQNAVLFFDECEVLFEARSRGNALMTLLLTEVERLSSGHMILATNSPHLLDDALDRRILVRVDFRMPDRTAREAIWRCLLPAQMPLAPDVDLALLAERHELSGGSIKNAILCAAASAIRAADDVRHAVVTHAMLDDAAAEQGGGRRTTQADHDRAEREAMDAPRRGGRMGFGAR
jgi:MoxR-like ATPase